MLKVKYKIWIVLLLLSFAINFVMAKIPSFIEFLSKEPVVVEMYIQSTENPKIKNQLINIGSKDVSIKIVNSINENTEIILTDKIKGNINLSEYEKHEGVINSPIVLFAPRNALNENENFSAGVGNSNSLTKDLHEILVAIEQNKKWNDIGISNNVVSGNVSLVIPKRNNAYYPAVVETIYMALNQKDVLTLEDVEALKSRVNNILSKCIEVEDIGRYISNMRENNNNKLSSLVLGPEFIVIDDEYTYSSDSDDWLPVYPLQTSKISLDLYIKKGPNAEAIKDIFSTQSFVKKTGMRTEYRKYKLHEKISGFFGAIEIVEFGEVEEGVRDKIKENISLLTKVASVNNTEDTNSLEESAPVINNSNEEVQENEEISENIEENAEEKDTNNNNTENDEQDKTDSQAEQTTKDEESDFEYFFLFSIIFVLVLVLLFLRFVCAIFA